MGSTWSVNPIALAELLTGSEVPGDQWGDVQRVLEDAFHVKEEMIFQGVDADPPRLQLFQDLANAVRDPLRLAEIRDLPFVRQAAGLYGEKAIELALPYLVPVADAEIDSWAEIHDYVVTDVSYLDPVQGNAADCYLLSAMMALAWSRPAEWAERVRSMVDDSGPAPAYRYAFHCQTGALDGAFAVLPRLPADKNGRLAYARSSVQLDGQGKRLEANLAGLAEAWVPMLEKAFVMWQRPGGPSGAPGEAPGDAHPNDYHYISDHRLTSEDAFVALAGGVTGHASPVFGKPLTGAVSAHCDEPNGRRVTKEPTMAWTFEDARRMHGLTFGTTGLVPNHAYAVLGILCRSGVEYVVLRNPWGHQPYRPDGYADGTWNPGAGPCGAPEVELNAKGVFAICAEWFDRCFAEVAWVKR